MKSTTKTKPSPIQRNADAPGGLQRKLAVLASGGAALGAWTPALQGALVPSTTIPPGGLTPPASPGPVFWDVDGNGSNDFVLLHATSSSTHYASFGGFNDARVVEPAGLPAISKLPEGFVVGPTMVASFNFKVVNTGHSITSSSSLGAGAYFGGWKLGDKGHFGFKFLIGADTHYGFGTMQISPNGPAGQGFAILNAWYDDQADTAVVVPESSTTAALLALGAAGVITWRQRRKQQNDNA